MPGVKTVNYQFTSPVQKVLTVAAPKRRASPPAKRARGEIGFF
jgi:hypothetical protein